MRRRYHPFADPTLIRRLISRRAESRKPIVAGTYADTLRVPALFDRIFFEELLALPDDCGAKPIILHNRGKVAEVSFPQGAIDIDTAEDVVSAIREQNGAH